MIFSTFLWVYGCIKQSILMNFDEFHSISAATPHFLLESHPKSQKIFFRLFSRSAIVLNMLEIKYNIYISPGDQWKKYTVCYSGTAESSLLNSGFFLQRFRVFFDNFFLMHFEHVKVVLPQSSTKIDIVCT